MPCGCLIQNFNLVQIEIVSFLILVDGYEREWVMSLCGQFMLVHSSGNFSPGLTDVAFAAVHTLHFVYNVSSFFGFELFFWFLYGYMERMKDVTIEEDEVMI